MFPIDIENKSIYREYQYIYAYIYLYIEFLASYFRDPSRWKQWYIEMYGWVIIEELSIRRRVHTFLVSWGQTTRVNNCYVDLSSSYEFWFPIIFIDMNVIFYRNPPILETFASMCHWPPTPQARVSPASCQHVGAWVDSACMSVHDLFVIDGQNSNRIIIALCICRHDIVAIMLSNPGVSK